MTKKKDSKETDLSIYDFITMKQEIRQDNTTILHSKDGCSIPAIFNDLTGKNFKGEKEAYSDYIRYIAIPYMGFTYGKIEYYSDGILIATGEITP